MSASYGHTQLGRGSKAGVQASACTQEDFPVAEHSCLVSSDALHPSHARNVFPAADKPRQSSPVSFSSSNMQTRLRGRCRSGSGITAACPRWRDRTVSPLTTLCLCPRWCPAIPRELTGVSGHMQARLALQRVLPGFPGELLALQRGNPAEFLRAHPCLLRSPPCPAPARWRGSGDMRGTCSAVWGRVLQRAQLSQWHCAMPSPINAWVNVVPPGSPRSGHRVLPDGLLYGLQPRPAVGEEVEHAQQPRTEGWPLFSTCEASSPACPRAPSSCPCLLPVVGSISPRGAPTSGPALLPPAWSAQAKPGDKPQPPGQYPADTDPWPDPVPAAPSCTAGAPESLSPARPRCAAPARIPFA